MKLTQVSVFLDNRKGRMMDMTKVLADNNIDIKALYVADTADYGILRMIVDDSDKAKKVLKDAGFTTKRTEVLAVPIEDVPGGLHEIVKIISENDISIEYIYAFTGRENDSKASVVMKLSDLDAAEALLIK